DPLADILNPRKRVKDPVAPPVLEASVAVDDAKMKKNRKRGADHAVTFSTALAFFLDMFRKVVAEFCAEGLGDASPSAYRRRTGAQQQEGADETTLSLHNVLSDRVLEKFDPLELVHLWGRLLREKTTIQHLVLDMRSASSLTKSTT
ncbi:unnamed protein product, partial [Amoebophrya sp. A25]